MVPYDAKYIYLDYNIVESVNVDRQSSGEFGGYGNIVYTAVRPEGTTEWDYIWADSSVYVDESMVALPKDVTIHGNNTVNAYDNTYGNVYTSGWKIGCIDVSAYAGQVIELNINISNYAYEDINLSKLLIDNIRFSDGCMENNVEVQYELVSSDLMPEIIRSIGIDSKGRSYVLYIAEFENPENGGIHQATGLRYRYMYENRYLDIEQVGFYEVPTEADFVDTWSNMHPGDGCDMIDDVGILCHANFYALMIDSGKNENLTTSPEGCVGSDSDSFRIQNLPVKKVDEIRIYGCCAGLIDAINIIDVYKANRKDEIYSGSEIDISEGYFALCGNVAQAFWESQEVNRVYAWDGSVTPDRFGGCRLSSNVAQAHFLLYVSMLKDVKAVDTYRMLSGVISPIGEVVYTNYEDKQLCGYIRNGHNLIIDISNNESYEIEEVVWNGIFGK